MVVDGAVPSFCNAFAKDMHCPYLLFQGIYKVAGGCLVATTHFVWEGGGGAGQGFALIFVPPPLAPSPPALDPVPPPPLLSQLKTWVLGTRFSDRTKFSPHLRRMSKTVQLLFMSPLCSLSNR